MLELIIVTRQSLSFWRDNQRGLFAVHLAFHPDASVNFAEKAAKLRERLGMSPNLSPRADPTDFPIDPHVQATIGTDDIIDVGPSGRLDFSGTETARYFKRGEQVVSVEAQDYQQLRKLAEQMQATTDLRDTVSVNTVVDILVEWFQASAGEESESAPDYVLRKCTAAIADRAVVIPIHELYVESPIDMGRITIRPVDRRTLDTWMEQAFAEVSDRQRIQVAVNRWRAEMQGRAAAERRITAEPRRAVEVARREAESALALLALFHPAMFHPGFQSHCVLLGSQHVDSAVHVTLRENRYESKQNYMLPPFPIPWKLSNATIQEYRQLGLDDAAALLRSEAPTKYQKKVLEALLLFTRSALTRELSERLLYMIVALETLLLRDRSEAIAQNIAERVAFLVATKAADRQQVVAHVKAAYGLRSEFVHHGATVEEMQTVQNFMHHAWDFFNAALRNSSKFKTRDELFELIDHLKFS